MYCMYHSLSLSRFCLHQCMTTTITITRAPAAIARRVTATAMATATEVSSVGSRGTHWYEQLTHVMGQADLDINIKLLGLLIIDSEIKQSTNHLNSVRS